MSFDKRLKKLVRAYYVSMSDEEYNIIGYETLLQSIPLDKQLKFTMLSSETTQNSKSQNFISFAKWPVDLIAYMLKDTNNNSIRSLLRVESFLRANGWKLISKIAVLRHGFKNWDYFIHKHRKWLQTKFEKYPSEALQTFELSFVIQKPVEKNNNWCLEFSNSKLIIIKMVSSPSDYPMIYVNEKNIFQDINYIPEEKVSNILGIPNYTYTNSKKYSIFQNSPNTREGQMFCFNLLVTCKFRLNWVNADIEYVVSSQRNGKPFKYIYTDPYTHTRIA